MKNNAANNTTKNALLMSAISMLLCVAMLVGATFAWFNDSTSTVVNSIHTGTLDIELQMKDEAGNWVSAEEETLDFVKADGAEGEAIIWEPGCTYRLQDLRLINRSNLALKYKVLITGIQGDEKLNEAIEWTIRLDGADLNIGEEMYWLPGDGTTDNVKEFTISGHMMETAGNEYQGLAIEGISITVLAAQYSHEHDSESNQYDAEASYHAWNGELDREGLINNTDNEAKTVTISTPEQLAALSEEVTNGNKYKGYTITLTNDIDLGGKPWTPIGGTGKNFQGSFDGANHTISNLFIDMKDADDVGLFGFTLYGDIKNFTINNAVVKGNMSVGVVAGTPSTAKYTNIKLTGSVKVEGYCYVGGMFGKYAYNDLTDLTIDVTEDSYVRAIPAEDERTYVGGIIAYMDKSTCVVSNVRSNIDVIGLTCAAGGITGYASAGNIFRNCSSSGDVTLLKAPAPQFALEIGGIAGAWNNSNNSTVTFENCSYTGTLSSYDSSTNSYVTDFLNNGLVGRPLVADGTGTLIIE